MSSSFSEEQRKKILGPSIEVLGYFGISAQVSDFRKDGYLNIVLKEADMISYNDSQLIVSELDAIYDVVEVLYVTDEKPTPGTLPHLLIRFKPKVK